VRQRERDDEGEEETKAAAPARTPKLELNLSD